MPEPLAPAVRGQWFSGLSLDFTGDGRADLLWHHATLGEVWIWTMNGATREAETWVARVPDVGYGIAAEDVIRYDDAYAGEATPEKQP